MKTLFGYVLFAICVGSVITCIIFLMEGHKDLFRIEDDEEKHSTLFRNPRRAHVVLVIAVLSGLALYLLKPDI